MSFDKGGQPCRFMCISMPGMMSQNIFAEIGHNLIFIDINTMFFDASLWLARKWKLWFTIRIEMYLLVVETILDCVIYRITVLIAYKLWRDDRFYNNIFI